MSSPRFKVIDAHGTYQASCKEPESAAALCAFYGIGSKIRDGRTSGPIVYVNGPDGDAGDSYDVVASLVWARIQARNDKWFASLPEDTQQQINGRIAARAARPAA